MKKQQKQQKKVPKTLEYYLKLQFIVLSVAFFIVTTGYMLFMMLSQLPENTNFSGYYTWALSTLVLPFLVLAVSYIILPRYATKVDKLFWTFVVAYIGILLFYVVQQFTYMIPYGLYTSEYYNENDWMIAEAIRFVIGFVPLVLYYGYLYWLRKKIISK